MYVVERLLDKRVHHQSFVKLASIHTCKPRRRTSRPNTHPHAHLPILLRRQRKPRTPIRLLCAGESGAQIADVVRSLDGYPVAFKVVGGVVGEALVEHGEDARGDVVDADAGVLDEGGVEFAQVVVAEVEELGGELDARGWWGG